MLDIDSSNHSLFHVFWTNDPVYFTLNRPDGQLIDPAYASANPDEVVYEMFPGSGEFPPYASYTFPSTLPGNWQLNISAGDVGPSGTDYLAFANIDSTRIFSYNSSETRYNVGDTAIFSSTLENSGVGIEGAIVTATINRPDGIVDAVQLTDQGNGLYMADYLVPNVGGHALITFNASANDNGALFTREGDLVLTIAPQDAQFTGAYSDEGNDDNSDTLYEYLDFTVQLDVAKSGSYVVSALLVSEDGQLIASFATEGVFNTGLQTITLPFNGDDIRFGKLDGPFVIANLQVTEITSGIPSQIIDEAWTTSAYHWWEFGSSLPKIYLPVIVR